MGKSLVTNPFLGNRFLEKLLKRYFRGGTAVFYFQRELDRGVGAQFRRHIERIIKPRINNQVACCLEMASDFFWNTVMQSMSPSGSKPARGERFKTGHSEVRDSYHFWFFNQGIFGCEIKRAGAELRALARGPGGRRFVGLPAFLVFLG